MYIGLNNLGLNQNNKFSPQNLFTAGEQGAWYDPSDLSSMYQDSAGTTPAVVGQPVGLILDKRLGLALGGELLGSGVINMIGAATAATYDTVTGAGTVSRVDLSNYSSIVFPSSAGTPADYDITNQGATQLSLRSVSSGAILATFQPGQRTTVRVAADSSSVRLRGNTNAETVAFVVNSIKPVLGNHASQATAASRPTLSARYNRLTKSDTFSDAIWVKGNASVVPDADGTAAKLVEAAIADFHTMNQALTVVGVPQKATVRAKAAERSWMCIQLGANSGFFNLATGSIGTVGGGMTATIAAAPTQPGYYDCTVTSAAPANANCMVHTASADNVSNYLGDGVSGIYVQFFDLRYSADAALSIPSYQRVNTSTDYDTAGFPMYLLFDGVDDGLATGSIDFSGTDKVSAWIGLSKLSDAARGVALELGNAVTNSFRLDAPLTAATPDYLWASTGSTAASTTISPYAAPISNVLTGQGDIANDICTLRVNGVLIGSGVADQGIGNYSNNPIYLGRRGGTSLPSNVRMYQNIIRGAVSNAAQVSSAERYVGSKMGIVLP